LYVGNRIVGNAGPGIHHEASFAAEFRDNWIENNGHERTSWVLGAGIFVNSSRNVTITGNTLVDNYQGVIAVQVTRSDGDVSEYGPHEIANLTAFGNHIEMPRGQTGIAVAGNVESPARFYSEITFYDNTYALGDQSQPFRIGESLTVEEWQAATLSVATQFVSLP
ncbi:MAG TPA: right-handed parallel beta-helix repeat-containing protein, partial [Trueperaceae bacterium]|nr:right-handed parallel beta-helix repeat-containing protein [Trueperaceae bacterium]